MRIVIADPDAEFRLRVVSLLRQHDFEAVGVASATSLYRDLLGHPSDVVILDPDLPGEDAYAVACYLSELNRVGIVMLCRHVDVEQRLRCLASGADACLAKTVDVRELIATLNRVSGRFDHAPRGASAAPAAQGYWTLLTNDWQLIAPTRACLELTGYEYSLLSLLFSREGETVSRRDIISTFGFDYRSYDERRLEAIVSRLRRKLEPHQGNAKPLQTAHGFGYAFTAPCTIRARFVSGVAYHHADRSREAGAVALR